MSAPSTLDGEASEHQMRALGTNVRFFGWAQRQSLGEICFQYETILFIHLCTNKEAFYWAKRRCLANIDCRNEMLNGRRAPTESAA